MLVTLLLTRLDIVKNSYVITLCEREKIAGAGGAAFTCYRGRGAAESLWGPSRAEESRWPREGAQGHTGLAHPLAL